MLQCIRIGGALYLPRKNTPFLPPSNPLPHPLLLLYPLPQSPSPPPINTSLIPSHHPPILSLRPRTLSSDPTLSGADPYPAKRRKWLCVADTVTAPGALGRKPEKFFPDFYIDLSLQISTDPKRLTDNMRIDISSYNGIIFCLGHISKLTSEMSFSR